MAPLSLKAQALIGSLGVLFMPSSAYAQPGSVTAGGEAKAQVVEPISVIAETELDFGFLSSGSSTAVVVPAAEGLTSSGASAARFRVKGTQMRSYQIQMQGQVAATGKMTGVEIPVLDLTASSKNAKADDWSGRLDELGEDTVHVGGTLIVPSTAPNDHYSAEVQIFVYYN